MLHWYVAEDVETRVRICSPTDVERRSRHEIQQRLVLSSQAVCLDQKCRRTFRKGDGIPERQIGTIIWPLDIWRVETREQIVVYTHKIGWHSLYVSDSDICRFELLNIHKKSMVVLDCKHNVLIHTESSKDVRTVRRPRAFPPQGVMIASTSNVLKVHLRRIR